MAETPEKKEFDWFDKKENQKKLWILMYASCALSVLAEIFVHRHSHFVHEGDDHGHHDHHFSHAEEILVKLETMPAFYAIIKPKFATRLLEEAEASGELEPRAES